MTQEEIEIAANQHCFIKTPDARERYLMRNGFKAGVNWRINSVWHTMDVEPKKDCLLVLHGNGRTITINWNGDMKWQGMDKFFRAEKWAYIEDLLPNKEE